MSDAPAAAPPPPPAKSSKVPLFGVVLTLANLGATGFVAMKVNHPPPPPAPVEHAPERATGPRTGPIAALDGFVVNLNEPNSSRYLKTTIELELTGPEVVDELAKSRPLVRDELLRYLSNLSVTDTLGEEGKAKIQAEAATRVDRALGGGRVRRLYFAEFVVQ